MFLTGCANVQNKYMKENLSSFGGEVDFLKQYTKTIVLETKTGNEKIAVCPELQGKIMASSLDGDAGQTFAWVNRGHIQSGNNDPAINLHGGEDRIWLGPQSGQFSIFNIPGDTFEKWFTPPPFNSEAFEVIAQSSSEVKMEKEMVISNYCHYVFQLKVLRNIRILNRDSIKKEMNIDFPEQVKTVGFLSDNTIFNTGDKPWKKGTGLLSIWILGMMKPTDETTVIFPYHQGSEKEIGRICCDDYFGDPVPTDRLKITDKAVYFKGDARYTSKIGLSPTRAKNIFGSYDSQSQILTVVKYSKHEGIFDYVNSVFGIQEFPYRGDAVNSYNDGPSAENKPGNIYELESSSPAAKLKSGESLNHIHKTFHFTGPVDDLSDISKQVLGVSIKEITEVFVTE